ncbi:MAG: sugar-binding domain-containing protein [bacterium]
MKTISLSGLWKAAAGISEQEDFMLPGFDDSGWAEIPVPSHWQEHETFKDYPEEVIYRLKFNYDGIPAGKRAFLRFKGIFYHARVWLNGKHLGENTGYFIPFSYEVTDVLNKGENCLAVLVRCEWEKDINDKKQIIGVFSHWDCKPNAVQPGGIWNDVEIAHVPMVFVESLTVGDYAINGDEAQVRVTAVIGGLNGGETAEEISLEWKIRPVTFDGEGTAGGTALTGLSAENREVSFDVIIPDARLWWTWDHGAPDLYEIQARLRTTYDDENTTNRDDTAVRLRFGIRTLEMLNWHLYLNGRRIFCRGSNYAPCDIRIADASRKRYEHDVRLMRNANFNIVRIHAHVEKDDFYDVCDEQGILVWQDFPLQWYYSEDVEKEAIRQIQAMVRLLARHPSVAVWCCHNEPAKFQPYLPLKDIVRERRLGEYLSLIRSALGTNWNKSVLDKKLAAAVRSADTSRPVVQHSGMPAVFSEGTDAHLYFGWYMGTMRGLEVYQRIAPKSLRFITEYGAQAFPVAENFRKIQNVDTLDALDWNALERNNLLQRGLMEKFVPSKMSGTIEEYIDRTQWYQARVIKYKTEFFRKLKYNPCGGVVHFMFTDCCPAITWAVVDFWRTPKRGYEVLAEAMRPLHIFADFPRRHYRRGTVLSMNIYVVNDLYREHRGAQARWCITDDERNEITHGEWKLDVGEDSIYRVGRARWETDNALPGGYAFLLELETDEGTITNQYEFEIRK